MLRARIALHDDLHVDVFVLHLKSKCPAVPPGEDPSDPDVMARAQAGSLLVRAAEAVAVRVLLNGWLAGRSDPAVVLGDLNDVPDAVTTEILRGPYDKDLDRVSRAEDVELVSCARLQRERLVNDRLYSYIYEQDFDLLDQILVSFEWVRGRRGGEHPVRRVGRFVDFQVLNDHLHDVDDPDCPRVGSDHGLAVAAFLLCGVG